MRLVDQAVDRSPRWLHSGFRDTQLGSGSYKKVLLFDIGNKHYPPLITILHTFLRTLCLTLHQLPSPHTRTVFKMLFSIQQRTASALGLAIAVSAAPLNDRSKLKMFERGIGLGWLCHFDGIAAPTVDASLNLHLCLEAFVLRSTTTMRAATASSRSARVVTAVLSTLSPWITMQMTAKTITRNLNPLTTKSPSIMHKTPTAQLVPNRSTTLTATARTTPLPMERQFSSSHHKKPKHHGEDSDGSVGAQSFNDAGDNDQPKRNHHSSHPSSVGALGEGNDDSERCNRNEHLVAASQNGKLDALLKLCLDVSVLGLTKPIHAEATVLPFGPGRNGKDGCPVGQQLSSLLNVCVDKKFFSGPLADNQCQQGWKLDLVLGTCLNLIGCQNQGSDN
ncbi:hypothetical protein H4Q26_010346 [Puccinia striiformis f. sp. tritici PST-130]|nr:hypothetical protein H4Q26_010346 [Puccinia striiformis f. sp. tritici PST-130]